MSDFTPDPADVELVARALFDAEQQRFVDEYAHLPAPAVRGRWSDTLATTRRMYEDQASPVLAALAAAGRLLPPVAESGAGQ